MGSLLTTTNVPDDTAEKGCNRNMENDRVHQKQENNTTDSSISSQDESPTTLPIERTIRGFRWALVCLAVFSSNLLYGLDTTIAADIQASVSVTFDNVSQLGWVGFGFGLGSTVAILPLGQAYGMFNTKWMYIGCVAMFGAGSALCGGAPSMAALIVGRIWAGVGGAGMYLGTLNIFSLLTGPREQSFYVSCEGFVYGAGAILGPVVGGLLADSAATWRWAFYMNVVIFGVTGPMFLFALPSLPQKSDVSWQSKLGQLDWLGILLNTALYTSFTLAIGMGGALWPWHDGRFIAAMVVAGILALVLAVTQRLCLFTTQTNRLFPCDFLYNPQLVLLYIVMACGGAALSVAIYYVPLYFLFVHGDSGTRAAIRLLPFVAVYVVSILTCGYALPRVGYHWLWFLGSGICLVAGGAAMYTIQADSPAAYTYGFSVLLGLGLTSSQASYHAGAREIRDHSRAPALLQYINLSQGSSQMLSLLMASAIFQSEAFGGMQSVLRGQGFSEAEIRNALAGAHSTVLEVISPELRKQCTDVIVHTIQKVWVLVIAAGGLQAISSLFLDKSRF